MNADRLPNHRGSFLKRNAGRFARAIKDPGRVLRRLAGAGGRTAYDRGRKVEKTVFVVGCGHSGTTLLATVLGAHPDIHLPLYETGAFMAPINWRLLSSLNEDAIGAGKRVLLEKTPAHVERIPKIRQALPGAKFIVIVRDGRDVTLSLGKRYKTFERGLARWIHSNACAARELGALDVLLVRYEDIVEQAPRELARICGFLGLPYSRELLRHHEKVQVWNDADKLAPGDPALQRANRVNQPIYDGRGKWRAELPAAVVQRFETGEAARLMSLFGYG